MKSIGSRAARFLDIPKKIKSKIKLSDAFFKDSYSPSRDLFKEFERSKSRKPKYSLIHKAFIRAALNNRAGRMQRALALADNRLIEYPVTKKLKKNLKLEDILVYIKDSLAALKVLRDKGVRFNYQHKAIAAKLGNLEVYKFLDQNLADDLYDSTNYPISQCRDFIAAPEDKKLQILDYLTYITGYNFGYNIQELEARERDPLIRKLSNTILGFLRKYYLVSSSSTPFKEFVPCSYKNKICYRKNLGGEFEAIDRLAEGSISHLKTKSLEGSILINCYHEEKLAEHSENLKGAYFVTNEDGSIDKDNKGNFVSLGTRYPKHPQDLGMQIIKPSQIPWSRFDNVDHFVKSMNFHKQESSKRGSYHTLYKEDLDLVNHLEEMLSKNCTHTNKNFSNISSFKNKTLVGSFNNCQLDYCDFSGANMEKLEISPNCSFKGANVDGVHGLPRQMLYGTVGTPASLQNMSPDQSRELIRAILSDPARFKQYQ